MRLLIVLAGALLCIPAPAASAVLSAASAGIDEAAWLAGRWVGEGLGGQIEETWSPASDGQMVGHFQLIVDGKPTLYELMLLDRQPEGLRLRVRHFNPDFTAWEDKGSWYSFEPVSAEPGRLRFEGLSFERVGDDLKIIVTLKQRDGSTADHPIKLKREPL